MLPLADGGDGSVGAGQAIREALDHRPARVVPALGGSGSTDGGAGMLSALGTVFRDALGRPFMPTGSTLGRITDVDLTGLGDAAMLLGARMLSGADFCGSVRRRRSGGRR